MDLQAPSCPAVVLARYAPKDRFLALLAEGWRFPGDVATEMAGSHGHWSVCLVREPASGEIE